jgi:sterol desaturase/sphingolipid hydroxylase (fatty acid hydroxylase superfamily)
MDMSERLKSYTVYLALPVLGVFFEGLAYLVRGMQFTKFFPYWHSFVVLFIMITMERVWTYRNAVSQRHMIWRDLTSTMVQTFMVGAVFGALVLPILHYFPNTFLGRRFLFGLSGQLGPLWVQVAAVFLLSSFWQYWAHRIEHTNNFLWKLHGYHHGVTNVQVSNVLVSNPLDYAIRNVLGGLLLSLVGFNPVAVVIAGIFSLNYGNFSHSGTDAKGGWLNYIFNGPEVHRWHHSTWMPDDPKWRYGCNFGVSTTFWDQLFGTFYLPKDATGDVLAPPGIGHPEGFPDEPIYWKMLIGLRAWPALERLIEGKNHDDKPDAVAVPAE